MSGTPGHVVIVGAGIVGVATAIWLQREGARVTLIDRAGPGGGASFGNGGVLASAGMVPVTTPGLLRKAPGMLLRRDQPLFLKWGYLPRLAPWLVRYLSHATPAGAARIAAALAPLVGDSLADHQALAAGTGAESWIHACDYLYLYPDRGGFAADAFAWDLRRAHGIRWAEMDAAALRAWDPVFGPALGFGVRMGGHGRIADPGGYVAALAAHVRAQGGRLIRAEAEAVVQDTGCVTGVRAGGETIACDAAVIAAGAWSGGLLSRLGLDVPLETERGYHLELWAPSAMPRAPAMIAGAKFVATPMEGRVRLAGVVEFGGLDARASRAPLELLRRGVRRAMPGLTWAEETHWLGHRPAPADSIPLIGPVPGVTGAWAALGHHHVGLTGGPATGRLLARMMAGRRPNLDTAPYDPARFARSAG